MGRRGKAKDDLGWADALDAQNAKRENRPPGEGWKTYEEILRESPVGDTNTRKFLRRGMQNGEMEVFEGRVVGAYGKLVRRVWYRPVP